MKHLLSTRLQKRTAFSHGKSERQKRKLKLKSYQKECVKFGVSRPAAGFFLAPGLGKTIISFKIFLILRKLGYVDEMMVLAKKRIVYNVWRQEAKKWRLPLTFAVVHGKDKKAELVRDDVDVRLMNYEGLRLLAERYRRRWRVTELGREYLVRRKKRIMLVIDESSKVRNTNTARFKMLKQVLHFFYRRYALTGSPAPQSLMNIFGQAYALDLGKTFGPFVTKFRSDYFYPSGYMGYDWKLQPGAENRIFKKLRPLVIRFGTDQLDMPPLTFVDRKVDLPPEARKLYDKLEQERIVELRDGAIVAANAAVATGKLRQIANGGVFYNKDGEILDAEKFGRKPPRYWKTIHDEKCEELVELLEELEGEPALVAFEFEHDKLRLQQHFKKYARQFENAPFIGGKAKDRDVERYLRQWDRGDLPVLFGQPDSVAHGLNLQGKGGIVIFFAMTWNLENYEQFVQRVWRQGQKRRVIVYRILARNTVDIDMVRSIKVKDHNQTTLLEAMERRAEHNEQRSRRVA